MPNDDTKNKKEQQHPVDDLKGVEELNRLLQPERSKGISRTNGVIAIIVGLIFIYVAIASDWNIIFRIVPIFGGLTFIGFGVRAIWGD
jgi:hypothetical protein